MRLEDPRDLPRVARHLQRHPIPWPQTLTKQRHHLGRRDDPTRRPHLTLLNDRDLAEVAMNIQPDVSHLTPVHAPKVRENRWANDTDGSVLTAQPRQSQGRPPRSRAQSSSRKKRPAQPAFSQKAPCPSRPNLRPGPDNNPHQSSFMPRVAAASGAARWTPGRSLERASAEGGLRRLLGSRRGRVCHRDSLSRARRRGKPAMPKRVGCGGRG
jgi:hypothetical protein